MHDKDLTLYHAQVNQPWTIPYSLAVASSGVDHIMGSHIALHAAKTVGKLAAVFEALDHSRNPVSAEQVEILRAMSADLVTAALRIANLYAFDLAHALVERVEEKNGVNILGQ